MRKSACLISYSHCALKSLLVFTRVETGLLKPKQNLLRDFSFKPVKNCVQGKFFYQGSFFIFSFKLSGFYDSFYANWQAPHGVK